LFGVADDGVVPREAGEVLGVPALGVFGRWAHEAKVVVLDADLVGERRFGGSEFLEDSVLVALDVELDHGEAGDAVSPHQLADGAGGDSDSRPGRAPARGVCLGATVVTEQGDQAVPGEFSAGDECGVEEGDAGDLGVGHIGVGVECQDVDAAPREEACEGEAAAAGVEGPGSGAEEGGIERVPVDAKQSVIRHGSESEAATCSQSTLLPDCGAERLRWRP
jgi:hypothetical protein